jgi:type IV pilus assembly protein PilP
MKRPWQMIPVLLLLSACGGSSVADIDSWMREEAGKLTPSVEPFPPATHSVIAAYESSSQLDPFDNNKLEPVGRRPGSGSGGPNFEEREKRNFILERYPLESMRFIGVMHIGKRLAVISVDNIVKQVTVGDYLGLDFGRITAIDDSELKLQEWIEEVDGSWMERTNTLLLQVQEESK